MIRRHFILATAGHVDHGKSALVKALTGTDPDRLPEEKARGITIELGFAHLELTDATASGGGDAAVYSLGIVDVPGHEDFVKNMVAGVGSIDLALLVVAADDGWMPQTEEHLQILEYLGVHRGVIALTKSDLVGSADHAVAAVRERLSGSSLAAAPIVTTSVPQQTGLPELRDALLTVLREAPLPRDAGQPRLCVDRAFSLKGLGTVVTGTLAGGRLKAGQEIVVQPVGLAARVRSIQSHGRQLEEALPGMRTALNLPEVPVSAAGQPGIARGQVVTRPGFGVVSRTWNARLRRTGRPAATELPLLRPAKGGTPVQVHHGSACLPARLVLPRPGELAAGGQTFAQLRFEAFTHALPGDRFVIRDWSERMTLAGGIVLEADAPRKGMHDEGLIPRLEALAAALADPERWLEQALDLHEVIDPVVLENASPFGADALRQAAGRMIASGRAITVGGSLIARNRWRSWMDTARDAITEFHRQSPEKPGLPVTDLRARFASLNEGIFRQIVENLERKGYVRTGVCLRAAGHVLALPPEFEAAARRVRRLLGEKPMEPPARKELAPDAATQRALRFLLDAGEAVELGPDLVLSMPAYTRAVELVSLHLGRVGDATVSELRPVLGTTRRILVPLLEHLDKSRVTVRDGDKRRLASRRSGDTGNLSATRGGG